MRFLEIEVPHVVDLYQDAVYLFTHRCTDAEMHQLTLTTGFDCHRQTDPVSHFGQVTEIWMQNRKRRQVLRRGLRIVSTRNTP